MERVAFSIFGIDIYYYSLCILVGIILAYMIITKEAKKHNISSEFITNLIFYTLLIGIIGARIYYCIFNYKYYNNILDVLNIRNGGLAIHGGLIVGIIFIYYYTKKYKINFIKMLDISAPAVILAQSIGRWGNFFNSEAHGIITTYSFLKKIHIPTFVINGMKINNIYYLPTFYFESIWCLIGFIIMLFIRKKDIKLGTITCFYLIWYSLGRFFIEILRTDSLMLFNIKVAMLISIISLIAGIILLIKFKNNEKYRGD